MNKDHALEIQAFLVERYGADFGRLALQRLCDHYDMDRDGRLFAFRKARDPRKASAA